MKNFLLNIGQQLIDFSVFITLFVECFSAIFKNVTHVLYEQKLPCKVGQNIYMGKKSPTKVRSGIYENEFNRNEFQQNYFVRRDLA